MLEISDHSLLFSFNDVHPDARLKIRFQRTLRVPDDVRSYPVPPGLGQFPLIHVDDVKVPKSWISRGGVILPMYQSEALWIDFHKHLVWDHKACYPFAVKIATGKINALSGQFWENDLNIDPQDYVVVPEQSWIDGYCVEKGIIRQFVAMPLGAGYSVEEQLLGNAEVGGLQIQAYPMKREVFEQRFPRVRKEKESEGISLLDISTPMYQRVSRPQAMSLASGGRIRQEIKADPFDPADWDLDQTSRCFVHLANSEEWKTMTGELPPTWLPEAEEYQEAGLPWLELYRESSDIEVEAPRRDRTESAEKEIHDSEILYNRFLFPQQRKKPGILKGTALLRKLKSLFSMDNS